MAKKAAVIIGVIFVIIAIWGFFQNPVLGLFEVDTLHNIVHLVTGAVLLFFGMKSVNASISALKWVAIVYLILAIIGFIQGSSILGIVTINGADNWLHVVLAIVIGAIGFTAKKDVVAEAAPQM